MGKNVGYAVTVNGETLLTPQKKPLRVASQALALAIEAEWKSQAKFSAANMPLTALAFTAIDRIVSQEGAIIEALLVYIDTDALCYRSSSSPALLKEQQKLWDPLLTWAGAKFSALWQTTTGIMPLEQPQAITSAMSEYLHTLSAEQLAGVCVLASGYSSVVLAIAVLEKQLSAAAAFDVSRLEEESQAEQWGRDEQAEARAKRLKTEIVTAGEFLRLLDVPSKA